MLDLLISRGFEVSFLSHAQAILALDFPDAASDLETALLTTQRQTGRIKNPLEFREAFASKFVADKFGEATTHWRKLEDRVRRGVGNPCPLVLIGLPASVVTFEGEPSSQVNDSLLDE